MERLKLALEEGAAGAPSLHDRGELLLLPCYLSSSYSRCATAVSAVHYPLSCSFIRDWHHEDISLHTAMRQRDYRLVTLPADVPAPMPRTCGSPSGLVGITTVHAVYDGTYLNGVTAWAFVLWSLQLGPFINSAASRRSVGGSPAEA